MLKVFDVRKKLINENWCQNWVSAVNVGRLANILKQGCKNVDQKSRFTQLFCIVNTWFTFYFFSCGLKLCDLKQKQNFSSHSFMGEGEVGRVCVTSKQKMRMRLIYRPPLPPPPSPPSHRHHPNFFPALECLCLAKHVFSITNAGRTFPCSFCVQSSQTQLPLPNVKEKGKSRF